MQKTVLMWFWWSKVIWSDAAFWLRMEKDSAPCSFGKSGSPEASGDAGGRLGRYKKKEKITHFFTLFFRNLKEIKKYIFLYSFMFYVNNLMV